MTSQSDPVDLAESKVNVLLIPDCDASGSHVLYLRALLNDPLFNVIEVERKSPNPTFVDNNLEETYTLLEELDKYKHSDQYVMLLKTSSITLQNTELLVETVKRAIEVRSDLYYFARYLDKCQLNSIIVGTDKEKIPELVQSWYPQGLQCVMFSPHGLNIILGKAAMKNGNRFTLTNPLSQQLTIEVAKGNMTALATNPVIFVFDTNLATYNDDYQRANVCQTVDLSPPPSTTGNLFLFILVVVIVIIAAWAIIVIFRKREPSKVSVADDAVTNGEQTRALNGK